MPKFRIEVRDRAMIDIYAEVEVEAETADAAVEKLANAEYDDPLYDLDFEPETKGWYEREGEPAYRVYDEEGERVYLEDEEPVRLIREPDPEE